MDTVYYRVCFRCGAGGAVDDELLRYGKRVVGNAGDARGNVDKRQQRALRKRAGFNALDAFTNRWGAKRKRN